jgi:hypothetical protein
MTSERRYHSRIPIPGDQSSAVLRAGRRRFAVRLVDVSAFGYAIVCPPKLNPRRGDLLKLGTNAGWVEVEVIRIQDEGDETIVGLKRVRDLHEKPDASFLDAIGGRAAALFVVAALLAGLVFGAVLFADSKHPWRRLQTEWHRLVTLYH